MLGLWVAVRAALQFSECLFMALKSGLANPVPGLGVVVFHSLADSIEMAELELSLGVPVLCCLAIPGGGLRIAKRDSLAGVVEVSQLLLGFREVLSGGQTIPVGSFGVALRNALPFAIHE